MTKPTLAGHLKEEVMKEAKVGTTITSFDLQILLKRKVLRVIQNKKEDREYQIWLCNGEAAIIIKEDYRIPFDEVELPELPEETEEQEACKKCGDTIPPIGDNGLCPTCNMKETEKYADERKSDGETEEQKSE